jgi:hypothetical protein
MESKVLRNLSSRGHQSLEELHAEIAFKQRVGATVNG